MNDGKNSIKVKKRIMEAIEFNVTHEQLKETKMTGDPHKDSMANLELMLHGPPNSIAEIEKITDRILIEHKINNDDLPTPTGEPASIYMNKCYIGNIKQLQGDTIKAEYHVAVFFEWANELLDCES